MKAQEIRQLSDAEIQQRLRESNQELVNLFFQKELRQLENPMRIRLVKRDIARMRTILRERGAAPAAVASSASPAPASEQEK